MDIADYFDRSSIFTKIMFTDLEIKNQFWSNGDYVRKYLYPYLEKSIVGTEYDS